MAEIVPFASDVDFEALEYKLSRALVARYGLDEGSESAAEAMAWGWANRDLLETAANPLGLLYRVGQSKSRRLFRWRKERVRYPREQSSAAQPWVEPGLDSALAALEIEQRTALILVHCFQWSYAEVAEVVGVPLHTVRNRVHRGLGVLRAELGVDDEA